MTLLLVTSGYELSNDRVSCRDVNECQQNTDGCSHQCINTVPGYTCACDAGFELAADQRTCTSKCACTSM